MKRIAFYIYCILQVLVCHAAAVEVKTVDELQSYFVDADPNTLAVFDVDMVLVQPDNPAFQMPNIKRYGHIAKRIMGELPSDKQMVFLALMTVSSKTILIDDKMPSLFHTLIVKKVPAIALTANLTGEFCGIKNMQMWRYNTLKELGIDFSKTSPAKTPIVFSELTSYRGNYTTYIDGMMFVNGKDVTKGEALIAFFDKAGYRPSKIIFVDDREENVKSVEQAAATLGIAYTGIHFLGAGYYPSQQISEEQFEAEWRSLATRAQSL